MTGLVTRGTGWIGLLLLLSALPLRAQTTGKIVGRVTDAQTGEPLPGVNVVILETQQGASTDADGYYVILNVRPGTYTLRASMIGFTPQVVQEVRVQINLTTEVNFTLQEETITGQEVVITATRPLVQRDLTATAAAVSREELAVLPVENFTDVVNLQAGVVEGHFRGGRIGEVAYLVDGVQINDVYDRSFAFQVENNAIQEIEVITGTFNAEYGSAQSGVVNIVTREGSERYQGSLGGYVGDYLTTATDLFMGLERISPLHARSIQGDLSGPLIPGYSNVTFFVAGRYVHNDGHLYGRRIVLPVDQDNPQAQYVAVEGRQVFVPALGDSALVPMNWSEQHTLQAKLTARLFGQHKLTLSGLWQGDRGKNYNHLFRYNPDGTPTVYGRSRSLLATYTHIFSSRTFAELKGAYFTNEVREYVYEDPLDPRYPRDDALRLLGGNFSFYRGGAIMRHFRRRTETFTARFDITSQVTLRHQMKAGVEFKQHTLTVRDFEVKRNPSTGFQPAIPPVHTPDHVYYHKRPIELSAYVQDKMEFDYLVVNVGLRFDFFDPRAEVLEDFSRPRTSPRRPAPVRWQLSPRLGLSFPISQNGAVRLAYGHFFQMPAFDYLYTNADYIYDPERGLSRAFGYAGLEPEQTVAYEIGLQQAFSELIGLNLVLYYKDIRNLLGTRIEVIAPGFDEPFQLEKYGRYVNRDYGQVKGFLVSLERRMAGGFGLGIDYTFQVARGNASDPRAVLIDEMSGIEPEKQLVPLDWDRRHQLNTSLTVGEAGRWTVTLVGRLGSGLPYTPSIADERIGVENSARRPGFVQFDLYASRLWKLGPVGVQLFARVYNVFDHRNEIQVYTDTGRAFPNLRYYSGEPQGLNSKEEFLRRPDFYSAPRLVNIGMNVTF
ncbi:TonB-dependent receptor [Rhodothermus marinus SG0.5JP17-172]|uniref:TonB-dependent receptor n=1 Tax=Rhodothermus marinus TaxID=29549 RepID=UPI000223D78A|nr:TonB-dependent receptor [Rhodothermus marinus]AEN72295.1 TonB-dependent receptor [Rhodothermus marinus SG0.5JP17-172]